MSEMVERAARAAFEGYTLIYVGTAAKRTWEEAALASKEGWRDAARAAIAALREPTEAMLEAAWNSEGARNPNDPCPPGPRDCWEAMIVEALK